MDSRTERVRITRRVAVLVVAVALSAAVAETDVAQAQMVNPYAGIDWEKRADAALVFAPAWKRSQGLLEFPAFTIGWAPSR